MSKSNPIAAAERRFHAGAITLEQLTSETLRALEQYRTENKPALQPPVDLTAGLLRNLGMMLTRAFPQSPLGLYVEAWAQTGPVIAQACYPVVLAEIIQLPPQKPQ
jgi:hypothetical protein